jgi:beta-mannosidase
MGRFISEFGMHAAPVRETLRRAMPEDQLYHHSPSMDHHNKDAPKNKGDDLMLSLSSDHVSHAPLCLYELRKPA